MRHPPVEKTEIKDRLKLHILYIYIYIYINILIFIFNIHIDKLDTRYKIKDLVAFPLSILFNRLIEESVVPSDWKRANITPIFKKGDRSNVENYRPVSLTPFFGKVFEKIIKNYIENFLIHAKIVKSSQHGFL